MGKKIIITNIIIFLTLLGCSIKSEEIYQTKKDDSYTTIVDTTVSLGNIKVDLKSCQYYLSVLKDTMRFDTSLSLFFKEKDRFLRSEIRFLSESKSRFILRVSYGMNSHSDIIVYPFLEIENKMLIVDDLIQINDEEFYKFILPNENDTTLSMLCFNFQEKNIDTVKFDKLNPNTINYIDGFDTIYYNDNHFNIVILDSIYFGHK